MFKKVLVLAAAAALFMPLAAKANTISSSAVQASAVIQPLCHTVSLGAFVFGPILPNGQTSNSGQGQGNDDYAASSLTNDCVSGTTYQIAFYDTGDCNLTNGSSSILWNIAVNGGSTPLLNCSGNPGPTPPSGGTDSFAAGSNGTNTIQLVGYFAPPKQSDGLATGTYTDSVTAVIYF
jgi:hypothetical protein